MSLSLLSIYYSLLAFSDTTWRLTIIPIPQSINTILTILLQYRYVPKAFKSFRNDFAVRCNVKTAEGLMYPLAKTVIFINKPTIVCKYEDIEYIEFQRVAQVANSASRSFDMVIMLKKGHSGPLSDTQYMFSSIDRTEYSGLYDFFEAKKISIMGDKESGMDRAQKKAAGMFEGMEGGGDEDEDEEEDDDYEAGKSDHSADSDDSGSESDAADDDDGEGEGKEKKPKKERKPKAAGEGGEKKRKAAAAPKAKGEKGEKKKRAKKDPGAPKKPQGAFFLFMHDNREKIKTENPGLKVTEVGKLGGELWKAATAEVKAEYDEKVKADKERYAQEMKIYSAKQAASGADLDLDSDDDL
jgi:structure-specific recognition protein 1